MTRRSPIKAVVIDRIKGGLTVDIAGARAFLPGSQVDCARPKSRRHEGPDHRSGRDQVE